MNFAGLKIDKASARQKISKLTDTGKKGGRFYDKLGAEVGTQNAIKSALATFID